MKRRTMRNALLVIGAGWLVSFSPGSAFSGKRPSAKTSLEMAFAGAIIENRIHDVFSVAPNPNFDAIEGESEFLRVSRERTSDGQLKLTHWHIGLRTAIGRPRSGEHIKNWMERYPKSITALIASVFHDLIDDVHVGTMNSYALISRAFDSTLQPKNVAVPKDAVARAERRLVDAKPNDASYPFWHVYLAKLRTILGHPKQEFLSQVLEGLDIEPDFALAEMAANYFLPKWHGDATQLEAYAAVVTERLKAQHGSGVYVRIYWQAFKAQYEYDLFKRSNVDWQRMKPAINDLLTKFPSPENTNIGALFACLAGDRAETARLIFHPDFAFIANIWRSDGPHAVCESWARMPELPGRRT